MVGLGPSCKASDGTVNPRRSGLSETSTRPGSPDLTPLTIDNTRSLCMLLHLVRTSKSAKLPSQSIAFSFLHTLATPPLPSKTRVASSRLGILRRHFCEMAPNGTAARLDELRRLMSAKEIDIYGSLLAIGD